MAAKKNLKSFERAMIADYLNSLSFTDVGHMYRYGGQLVPHITGVPGVGADYTGVPPKVLQHASWRGTQSHIATEEYDRGTIDWTKLHHEVEPRLEAWVRAVNELEIVFEIEDIERPLYHPIYRYAGRGDRPICYVRGILSTLEIKTICDVRSPDAAPHVGYQLAGQQLAVNHERRLLGLPETIDRWAIILRPDGNFRPLQYKKPSDAAVFLAHLTILNEEVSLGKRSYYRNGK